MPKLRELCRNAPKISRIVLAEKQRATAMVTALDRNKQVLLQPRCREISNSINEPPQPQKKNCLECRKRSCVPYNNNVPVNKIQCTQRI